MLYHYVSLQVFTCTGEEAGEQNMEQNTTKDKDDFIQLTDTNDAAGRAEVTPRRHRSCVIKILFTLNV